MDDLDDANLTRPSGLDLVKTESSEMEALSLAMQEIALQKPNTNINPSSNDMPPQILFALQTFGQALEKCGQSMLNLAHLTRAPGQIVEQLEQTVQTLQQTISEDLEQISVFKIAL
jgi:hypothetical protein